MANLSDEHADDIIEPFRNLEDEEILDAGRYEMDDSSSIAKKEVKHATLDSDQLYMFKKCSRPCLRTFPNLVREESIYQA